jgi:4'-phosphopantetheinyl transferase
MRKEFNLNLLKPNQIQIWLVNLEAILSNKSSEIERMLSFLSSAEIQRAQAFQSSDRYQKYIFTRGILRILLGEYLGIEPQKLEIQSGIKGKPFLSSFIHFNLSHSHDLALLAFSLDGEIGIDLEYLRTRNVARLAKRIMNPEEQRIFDYLSPAQQLRIFYQFWTKKEAAIKLNGTGIFQPSPALAPSIFNFVPESSYVAAIAHPQLVSSYIFQDYLNQFYI